MNQQQLTFQRKTTIFGPNPWVQPESLSNEFMYDPLHITFRATKTIILNHDRQTIEQKNIEQSPPQRKSSSKKKIFQNRNSYSLHRQSSPSKESPTHQFQSRHSSYNRDSKQIRRKKQRKHKIFGIQSNLQVQQARQSRVNQKLREMISNRNDESIGSMGYASHILKNSRKHNPYSNQNNIFPQGNQKVMTPCELSALLHQLRHRHQTHHNYHRSNKIESLLGGQIGRGRGR